MLRDGAPCGGMASTSCPCAPHKSLGRASGQRSLRCEGQRRQSAHAGGAQQRRRRLLVSSSATFAVEVADKLSSGYGATPRADGRNAHTPAHAAPGARSPARLSAPGERGLQRPGRRFAVQPGGGCVRVMGIAACTLTQAPYSFALLQAPCLSPRASGRRLAAAASSATTPTSSSRRVRRDTLRPGAPARLTRRPERRRCNSSTSTSRATPSCRTRRCAAQRALQALQALTRPRVTQVMRAAEFAAAAHAGQVRRTGEAYVTHAVETARIMAGLVPSSSSRSVSAVAAALLHDVVDDTSTTVEDVAAAFGAEIASLVDGVTRLSQLNQLLRRHRRLEMVEGAWATPGPQASGATPGALSGGLAPNDGAALRALILSMVDDPRVVLLKLADRFVRSRASRVGASPSDARCACAGCITCARCTRCRLKKRAPWRRRRWACGARSLRALGCGPSRLSWRTCASLCSCLERSCG